MVKGVRNAGFTLIEVIVVAAIIAILAGILVPMIFNQIDESKKTRALADIKSIQTAILSYRKDTGQWPLKSGGCVEKVTMLNTATGSPPTDLVAMGFNTAEGESFASFLTADTYGCNPLTWKGPYITDIKEDPWGNQYVINTEPWLSGSAVANHYVWILSAGPKGVLETATTSDVLVGDDIGIRLK